MSYFVWCKKEECRLPNFRCLICKEKCHAASLEEGQVDSTMEALIKSGRYKERYIMKRKESTAPQDRPAALVESTSEIKNVRIAEPPLSPEPEEVERRVFLLEEGQLKPFTEDEYTESVLYQVAESFSVECRLVRPEDPGNVVFEGKKPSRKTVPILVSKNGDCTLLESWESLETRPQQLADVKEVIGATPVKQVFVLRRK